MCSDFNELVRSSPLSPPSCCVCSTTATRRRRRRRIFQHSHRGSRKRPRPTVLLLLLPADALVFSLFLLNLLTRRPHGDTHSTTNSVSILSSSSSSPAGGAYAFSPSLDGIFPRTPRRPPSARRRLPRDRPRDRCDAATTTTQRAAESTLSFGQWREATPPFGDGGEGGAPQRGSGTAQLSRASYALVCSAVEQQQQQQALLPSEQASTADASCHVQLDVTARQSESAAVSAPNGERGRWIVGDAGDGAGGGGIGDGKDREVEKPATRRRWSADLDGDWPEVSDEVPFEFARLREVITHDLQCSTDSRSVKAAK